MPTSIVSAQTILKTTGGVPADYCTNTMHFELTYDTGLPGEQTLLEVTEEAQDAITAMYESIRTRLGGLIIGPHLTKWVRLEDLKPQYPYAELEWSFSVAPPAAVLPHEVAIVGSYYGQPVPGVPRASLRNRIYLGPIASSSVDTSGGLITAATVTAVTAAFTGLKAATVGDVNWDWVTWSPTREVSSIVAGGFVNNEFDTQRRRGVQATSRTEWP